MEAFMRMRQQAATSNSLSSLIPRNASSRRFGGEDDRSSVIELGLNGMESSVRDMEHAITLVKEVIGETSGQLLKLKSRIKELRTLVGENCSAEGAVQHHTIFSESIENIFSNNTKECKRKNDDVILLSDDESDEGSCSKKLRTNSEPEIQVQPGRSSSGDQQNSGSSPLASRHLIDELKAVCSDMADLQAEAVALAVHKTKGILSHQDFLTFLHVSSEVDDPLQLARVAFTTSTSALYFQLLTFAFHLKNVTRGLQKDDAAFQMDGAFENVLNNLIRVFREGHMSKAD